ncbi:M1 family metallopeptidase [candidate division KSB1 bacterium]|nr:M1 family metallopeptidase [candidate division KSB1 bacterium]
MKPWILLLFVLILSCSFVFADSYPRNPNIDVLHYKFQLTLSDETDEIRGHAEIEIQFKVDDVSEFALDLIGQLHPDSTNGMTVTGITQNEQAVAFSHKNYRIHFQLRSPSRANERRTYAVSYHGIPADGLIISENMFGERTFFGDNWPNRARHWLPTIDHPYDKATCEFIVEAPEHYQVVSNGLLQGIADLPENRRRTHWRTQIPMPTKVMVIGVAHFAVETAGVHNGKEIQSWVYAQNREAGFHDFAQAVRVVELLANRIGPFPYDKLANVQSRTKYGGMENAGAIFYNEKKITGKRDNENLIAHEIAHQWFGDSVTEADWHHVWLSESFATYFSWVFDEFTYGRERLVEDLKRGRERVLNFYQRRPESPIVDSTIIDLNNLLNANTYPKGAWVLHMLRGLIGEDAFWQGIRNFYGKYRDKNALTKDFQQVMEKAASEDLTWFFQQWIHQPGQPRYKGHWHFDPATNELEIQINQVQKEFFTMPLQVGIYLDKAKPPQIETLQIVQKENRFMFKLKKTPLDLVLDPNFWMLHEAEFSKRK